MRTEDFEKAIFAMNCEIVIDEMKLRHSNVRQVNAHTNSHLIVWDEHGRAFSASNECRKEIFLTESANGDIASALGTPLERDKSFDLHLE